MLYLFIVLSAFLFLLIVSAVKIYNTIWQSYQYVKAAWSDIDIQLKRRHDLIPNLITVVQKYTTYEKNLFEQMAELRAQAIALPENEIAAKSSMETTIAKQMKAILAIGESYPVLKASEEYSGLQKELANTEDEIASARGIYNSNVRRYNTLIASLPASIVASICRFHEASYFQSDQAAN